MKTKTLDRAIMRSGKSAGRQRGFVLIFSAILLVVLSMLGITTMRSAIFDEKTAAANLHKNLSFQAADNALAKTLHAHPGNIAPAAKNGSPEKRLPSFFRSVASDGSPEYVADVSVSYDRQVDQIIISGFSIEAKGLFYTALATGMVDGSGAETSNRMGLALIR